MTFKQGLLRARSHIIFIIALCVAFSAIIFLDALGASHVPAPINALALGSIGGDNLTSGKYGLSLEEKDAAKVAWQYFENNYQPKTGLVNSADRYPSTTMWDQASYMLATISAYRLGVIDHQKFDQRISHLLEALVAIPLFEDTLPNKAYSTLTLEMTDYNNNPSQRGIGWSALDIGRLATPLNILLWNYPEYAPAVRAVIQHWKIEDMLDDGYLIGTRVNAAGDTERVQEGRIGYEEYAASSLALLAYDVKRSLDFDDFLKFEKIYGIGVPTDIRDFKTYGAHNYVVSEPYILAGLEYGLAADMKELAYRVYAAQERRYVNTGQLTAVSEDNIDRSPYFVYNTVFTNGKKWNAITESGEDASEFRTISTKAAFGWDALYNNDYTDLLMERVLPLRDNESGFYSGWYETLNEENKSITANSNGIILESLHYKVYGKLVAFYPEKKISPLNDINLAIPVLSATPEIVQDNSKKKTGLNKQKLVRPTIINDEEARMLKKKTEITHEKK